MSENPATTAAKPATSAAKPAAPVKKSEKDKEMIYIISKFSPVYVASWNGEQSSCSICKNDFLSPCAQCEANNETDPCPVQEGTCGHKFHLHCITKWTKTNNVCPMCSQSWEIKT